MNDTILVAYASRTGTTRGVAEEIGDILADHGMPVEVLPMVKVTDVKSYRAVVAGSAIQAAAWLPEAIRFLQTHRVELNRKPFAAFLVCMTLAMPKGEQYRQNISGWMNPVRALVQPVSVGMFPGALHLKDIPSAGDRLKFRLSVMMGVWKEGDHRDWPAIRLWTEGLLPLLNRREPGNVIGEYNGRPVTAQL